MTSKEQMVSNYNAFASGANDSTGQKWKEGALAKIPKWKVKFCGLFGKSPSDPACAKIGDKMQRNIQATSPSTYVEGVKLAASSGAYSKGLDNIFR